MNSITKEHLSKRTGLFIFLAGLFLTTAVVAEMIGIKLFNLETILGIKPLFGSSEPVINLSTGVLIWPIVFVLSDLINEYFGRSGVKRISILGAVFIAYSFLIIFAATKVPPMGGWIANNQSACGGNFDINCAFNTIFGQGLTMIISSLVAFVVGQLLDAYVFYLFKKKWSSHKNIWLRATGSTLVSQLFDSFIVLFLAFYVFGKMTFGEIISICVVQYIFKMLATFLLIPVLYLAHGVISRYLGKELSDQMVKEDIKHLHMP